MPIGMGRALFLVSSFSEQMVAGGADLEGEFEFAYTAGLWNTVDFPKETTPFFCLAQ
jgi:hypothetical protein